MSRAKRTGVKEVGICSKTPMIASIFICISMVCVCLVCLIMCSGCTDNWDGIPITKEDELKYDNVDTNNKSGMLIILEDHSLYDIVYDKDTGVMYYRSNIYTWTLDVLYDADGKPRLYK